MQLVINIDENLYTRLFDMSANTMRDMRAACSTIRNGTPIPKGHGRLKDFDKIEWYGCTTDFDCPFRHLDCKDCKRAECDKTQVDEIPTIIEADRSEEDG
jgi:hypothetical protein